VGCRAGLGGNRRHLLWNWTGAPAIGRIGPADDRAHHRSGDIGGLDEPGSGTEVDAILRVGVHVSVGDD
jgi:hypothetical protein